MTSLLNPGHNCERVVAVESAGLLIDARDYYRAAHAALSNAQHTVLIAGWQFDSAVPLLRGAEAEQSSTPVSLLPLLEHIVRERPELRVYVLAWDYSLVFAAEREWLARVRFDWLTDERIQFKFDSLHPAGACHHQKVVVVDGALAFAGGVDLCDARWDDRAHAPHNADRVKLNGEFHKPYHDVMAYCTGPVVAELQQQFCTRWQRATGQALQLSAAADAKLASPIAAALERALPISCSEVAVSLTYGEYAATQTPKVEQIRALYEDAIASAERLIYIETQYFTSRSLHRALTERMQSEGSKLEVVIMLPQGADTPKENFALGDAQRWILSSLCQSAREHGHRLRVLCSVAPGPAGEPVATFIHSKLLVVDDHVLTVGSANCTNRSMHLDSELNLVWDCRAQKDGTRLSACIARIRASLLCEHAGIEHDAGFEQPGGIVERIDALIGHSKLQLRELPDSPDEVTQNPLLAQAFDPERALTDLELDDLLEPHRATT